MLKKLLFLLLTTFILLAQENPESYVPGQLIVHLKHDAKIENLEKSFSNIGLQKVKLLSKRLNIWLVSFDNNRTSDNFAVSNVNYNEDVKLAQFNHHVQRRIAVDVDKPISDYIPTDMIPNDPQFGQQWALNNTGQTGGTPDADIDAVEAWDLYPGGPTALGDEIVIAIIDGGCDINHEDLNIWTNEYEIPGNNIDDDNNGYIDDIHGWNAYNSNGNIPSDGHGTHVSGIAAAVGNNSIGVAGVNLDAKIMAIAGSSSNESIVVEAYGYALEMRARYNETEGQEGAFVVVTNASFGVDYGNPANYPIWCAMYDSLGNYGILSCGATANLNIDIDIQGDVPTACPSDYMVAVTNTTNTDAKNSGAAYGLTTIDLGAPGTSILNTYPGNGYSSLTGTSMASPTVAGAIALMFAAANEAIMNNYKTNPDQVALQIKQFLLDGTDPIAALQGKTVSGGRLNLYNALLPVIDEPDTVAPSRIIDLMASATSSNAITLTWTAPYDTSRNGVVSYDIRFSELPINNDDDFNNAMMIDFGGTPADSGEIETFAVENLEPATIYHFAIKSSDIWGNVSVLSNAMAGTTWVSPEIAIDPAFISVQLQPGASANRNLNIANISAENSTLDYSISLENNTFPSTDFVKIKLTPKVTLNENRSSDKDNPIEFGGYSIDGFGGPDNFGYEWIDSDESNGPAYEWNDISSTGTVASNWTPTGTFDAKDEGYSGPYDLGFNFKFYGEEFSEVYFGSNGFITFEPISINTYSNVDIPNSETPNNLIAAFWDDLDGSDAGNVYYKQDGNKFTIQYDSWPEYFGSGTYTFQIVLYSSGKVLVYYKSVSGDLAGGTVGIESPDGSDGLAAAYNSNFIKNEFAIKYAAEPDWVTLNNFAGTLYNGNSVDVELSFVTEDLQEGNYTMDLVIASNDATDPTVTVPISMLIGQGGADVWSCSLLVADNDLENQLYLQFGQADNATAGIDSSLGEYELPPLPPAGVFDARFIVEGGLGTPIDLRSSGETEIQWEVNFQPGSGGYPFTLSWDPNFLPDYGFVLQDIAGGVFVNVNMKSNNSVVIENENIDKLYIIYSEQQGADMVVNEGWNLISMPILADDMNVNSVFPDAASDLFMFNSGYVPVDMFENGLGYWIKFDNAGAYPVAGVSINTAVSVMEGWNLIGPFQNNIDVNSIVSQPANIISSVFYGFNGSYTIADVLMPTKGYWVKTSEAGNLYYNPVAKNINRGTIYETLSELQYLTIKDAKGRSFNLYFGNESSIEMPPVPPAGVFDVRFASGNLIENSSAVNIVELNYVAYPITISSNGIDVTVSDAGNSGLFNGSLKAGESITLSNSDIKRLNISTTVIPDNFALSQNYPNPFNPSTVIKFALPVDASVSIRIYNIVGEEVMTVSSVNYSAGVHEFEFNGTEISSGVYFYTIQVEGIDGSVYNEVKKMMMLK